MTTLDIALHYLAAGLSVVPVKPDGSKQPDLYSWKEFQSRRATEAEARRWWSQPRLGVGIVCGSISGGLEVLDFDTSEVFAAWRDLVVPRLLPSLDPFPQVETPSGGRHIYYRTRVRVGNKKLALTFDGTKTLIETRGEGGYVLAPGCPPACHPRGREYRRVAGPTLLHIPQIEDLGDTATAGIEYLAELGELDVLAEPVPYIKDHA